MTSESLCAGSHHVEDWASIEGQTTPQIRVVMIYEYNSNKNTVSVEYLFIKDHSIWFLSLGYNEPPLFISVHVQLEPSSGYLAFTERIWLLSW